MINLLEDNTALSFGFKDFDHLVDDIYNIVVFDVREMSGSILVR